MATTQSIDERTMAREATDADGSPWLLLAAAILAATALVLWVGRGTTFSADEFSWVLDSSGFGLHDAIEPYNGHLVLTSRLVYAGFLEVFGSDYLPFRILAALSVAVTGTLFFVYARPRIGWPAALAPTVVLLVFGSDPFHVLHGNAFTVLLAVSCGLGALIALRREDRRGEVAACGLLCLGVASYTVALAFVIGVAVLVLLRGDRWRRIWIAVVPAGLYAIWWVWSLQSGASSESLVTLSNVLLLPSWSFQALSAVISALSGLDYEFEDPGDSGSLGGAGATLAVLALGALVWRLWRRSGPVGLWAALAVFVALETINVLVASATRFPGAPRYLFANSIAVLLIAAEAAALVRWRRAGLTVLYAFAVIGVATNIALLRDASSDFRLDARIQGADLAAIDIAGESALASFDPRSVGSPVSPLVFPSATGSIEQPPVRAYLDAAREYEPFGFSLTELRETAEIVRSRADEFLAGVLQLRLAPAGERGAAERCAERTAGPDGAVHATVDAGRTTVIESDLPGAQVRVRRFATTAEQPLGDLEPGRPAFLTLPGDHAPDPWQISVTSPAARLCARP